MKSEDLVNLMFSPSWVSKLLHYFLSGAQRVNPKGIKTELLYLSLPFIIDNVTRKKLSVAITTSSFSSILNNKNTLEIKNALLNKNNQVEQYREFTNKGLIYLANVETLKIDEFITVENIIKYKKEKHAINRDYCKAAYYLGGILAKEDYRNVFVKLGITNI